MAASHPRGGSGRKSLSLRPIFHQLCKITRVSSIQRDIIIWTCAYHWLRSLLNNGILFKRPDTVHHASGNENLPILWCVYFCLWSQRHLHPAFDDVVDLIVGIMPMWWDTERDVVRCGVQLRSYYLDAHDPIAVFQKGLWTTSSVTRVPVQISVQMDLDLPSWCHLRGL